MKGILGGSILPFLREVRVRRAAKEQAARIQQAQAAFEHSFRLMHPLQDIECDDDVEHLFHILESVGIIHAILHSVVTEAFSRDFESLIRIIDTDNASRAFFGQEPRTVPNATPDVEYTLADDVWNRERVTGKMTR